MAHYLSGYIRQVSDEDDALSLTALQDLKHLEILHLEKTRVTDEAINALPGLEELSDLSLNSTIITDKCLEHLSRVKNLVNLCVQGTLLTNGALESFNPPITLKLLDLRDCWLLTMDSLSMFCKKHSGVKVRHDLLSPSAVDQSSSHQSAAPLRKDFKASKLKQRDGKSSVSTLLFKVDVLGTHDI